MAWTRSWKGPKPGWRRTLLAAVVVLAVATALWLVWRAWLAPTRVALVNYPEFQAARLVKASPGAFVHAEALLFGSQAVRLAQGQATRWWRWLAWLPPPSVLLSLFFAQVALMLLVDGWDYGALAWLCALGFAALLAAATALLRWSLPDRSTRCVLRVGLHGAQAVAGLWLARPGFQAAIDPVPIWGGRLAIVAVVVAVLAALGWLLQRRR